MSEHPTVLETKCFFIEPWESVYMLFLLPGLIIWIAGVVWCLRKRNIRGAVLLQVIGAGEVAAGSVAALVVGMKDMEYDIRVSGAYDPKVTISDMGYISQVAWIGLLVHFALLAVSLVLAVRMKGKTAGI